MPFPSATVANEFLSIAKGEKAHSERASISPMKIQKLVYFAHGWHLALREGPLISEAVQAWEYGPVIPSLYQEFKSYGNGLITDLVEEAVWDETSRELSFVAPKVSDDIEGEAAFAAALIKKVADKYAGYTAVRLSNATHAKGTPWEQVYKSGVRYATIPDGLIKDYFKGLMNGR